MLLYLGVVGVVAILMALSDSLKQTLWGKVFYWSSYCVVASIVAFRWGVGHDFANFYDVETVPLEELTFWPVSGEEFNRYGVLLKGLYYLADYLEYRPLIFMVSGFATYLLWFKTIERYSCNRLLSFSVIVAFFLSPSFNAAWQLWAVGFAFYGYKYVREQKLIPFTLCVIAGWSIHASAVLALLIYPIYNWISPRKTILISIIAVFTGSLLWKIITFIGLYGNYAELVDEYPGGKKLMLLYPVIVIGLCALYVIQGSNSDTKDNTKTEQSDFWRMIALVAVGCVFPFLLGPHIGNRCGFYFQMFLTLLFPLSCKRLRLLPFVFSVMLCSFFFITIHLYRCDPTIRDTHIPYRSIFNADFDHVPWENESND